MRPATERLRSDLLSVGRFRERPAQPAGSADRTPAEPQEKFEEWMRTGKAYAGTGDRGASLSEAVVVICRFN
jgi:hypothetical protein